MIKKLQLQGVHFDLDDDLRKYVKRKIGRLDLYMPLHARKSVSALVTLKEHKTKTKDERICEVILYLPHETINTKEANINMYAAIDVAEATLKNRLKKYKDTHSSHGLKRRVLAKLKTFAGN